MNIVNMRIFIVVAIAVAIGLVDVGNAQTAPPSSSVPTTAAAPPPPYGVPITIDQARRVAEAAEAEARRNTWNVVITIVDAGGHIVYLRRMDGTQYGSLKIAEGKAMSAVAYRRSTKALEDSLASSPRLIAVEGLMPIEGGLPIIVDGRIVGGIGVSGVTSAQDGQIAASGIAALKN